MKPILHSWISSPPARSVLLLIRYLNLDVEIKERDSLAHKSPEFGKMNPDRKIPVLEEDGFFLAESTAINRYLAESKAPEKADELLGKTPKERAIISHRLCFSIGTLFQKCYNALHPVFAGKTKEIPQSLKDQCFKSLEILETFIGEFKYAAADRITLADFAILPIVSNYKAFGVDFSKYPNILKWYESLKTIPGFEENEEGSKKLAEAIKFFVIEPFC